MSRDVFWGSAGAIPVSVQNGSTTGFSPEERKAYLAGWRAGREAAAEAARNAGYKYDESLLLAYEAIRALPEPKEGER